MIRSISSLAFVLALGAAAIGLAPGAVTAATATPCSGTLSGGVYESLNVPAGATCTLEGVSVAGSMRVGGGATLVANDSTIAMNVIGNRAASVQMMDTVVLGEINLQRTTGAIVIGADGCAVDPIADGNIVLLNNSGPILVCLMSLRNLLVQGNTNAVLLFDNVISNNLVVTQNSGPAVRIRGNAVGGSILVQQNSSPWLAVRFNTVAGNIRCTGNTSVPNVVGNTAGGAYLGQCAI